MRKPRSATEGRLARAALLLLAMLCVSSNASGHQPVMDMAPRWEDGFGFQVRQEYRVSDDLMDGRSDVTDPFDRKRRVSKTWLEGVYTFKRERRLTFKVPWVDQRRDVVRGGSAVRETGRGLGDSVLGLQLKRYYNTTEGTGNFGLTPSLRLPSGSTNDAYPVGDGSWDLGLSASFSAEATHLYQFYDVFYWSNGAGRRGINRGDEVGFDMNVGLHPYHNNLSNTGVFVMLDVSARYEARGQDTAGTTGGKRLSLGPVLVWYRHNLMIRAEMKLPVYEKVWDTQLSHGTELNIGVGVTF